MTAHNGRLESQGIAVPVGGWSFDFADGDGGHTGVVPEGAYSPTSLVTAFVAQLNAQSANTYTGSIANGEGGSGAVTFTNADADVTDVTFTDTDLADALGFSTALPAGGTELGPRTFTGLLGMRGLWLPTVVLCGPYVAGDPGYYEGGPTQTVSPLGVVKTISRPVRVKVGPFRWSHVEVARARKYSETGIPRSFERFMLDTLYGGADAAGYFTLGAKVRLFWNADDASYCEFWPKSPTNLALARPVQEYGGLYTCEVEGWKA